MNYKENKQIIEEYVNTVVDMDLTVLESNTMKVADIFVSSTQLAMEMAAKVFDAVNKAMAKHKGNGLTNYNRALAFLSKQANQVLIYKYSISGVKVTSKTEQMFQLLYDTKLKGQALEDYINRYAVIRIVAEGICK